MRAKNTSPPATVRRFNGGQFKSDGTDPQVGMLFGRVPMGMTNLDGFTNPKGPIPSKWAARVGVHPGAPQSTPKGPEHLLTRYSGRPLMQNYGGTIASGSGPDRIGKKAAAHVGGGHPRAHQG